MDGGLAAATMPRRKRAALPVKRKHPDGNDASPTGAMTAPVNGTAHGTAAETAAGAGS
eukprot:CAMPEP_0206144716 /NCGR_PEP_ID=MMETSP1473-20131121/25006_1 /ASSEMBLY_ACC=CAM_ASM_001109 /TAXON_ID=1461547 /ORGANISM="Stichococcus sp, Strain RCC1054" /LENGTH=57 /DNA_ID=CAMNT_0053540621 /DNA_START=1 /DNA_END=171 /DNA_ORIENTATION=+